MTLTQNKFDRIQKRKEITERGVLQELNIKNFIIEGDQKGGVKQKVTKKKESTYILKQKFH